MTQAVSRSAETFADPQDALNALLHRQAARGPQYVRPRTMFGCPVWTVSDWEREASLTHQ